MNFKIMRASSLAVFGLLLSASGAFAGQIFVKDGVALRGYDPVAYLNQQKAVPGDPKITAQYEGATFRFANEADRAAFVASPAKFVPAYGGYCAYGTALGHKAPTDPQAFAVINGKTYLNYNKDVQAKWKSDIPGYIAKAETQWVKIKDDASVE